MTAFLRSKKKRLLIVFTLLILAVILYVIKPAADSDYSHLIDGQKTEITTPREVIISELEKKIDSVLFTFNLDASWISDSSKETGDMEIQTGKKLFKKIVRVPKDLSLSYVNLDISNLLSSLNLTYRAIEDPRTRNLSIMIKGFNGDSDTNSFASIGLQSDNSIKRRAADVVLIFGNIKKIPEKERNEILNSPQNFNFVLPLSFEDSDIQASIIESGKNYVIYYTIGDEDNYTADFRSNMTERQWKTRITSLHSEYPGASGVIFRNPDKQYEFEKLVRDQFIKYNPNSYRDTLIKVFEPEFNDPSKVDELFGLIVRSAKAGGSVQFYIVDFSFKDFQRFNKLVYDLKKMGYRFETFRRGINLKRNLIPIDEETEKTETE